MKRIIIIYKMETNRFDDSIKPNFVRRKRK